MYKRTRERRIIPLVLGAIFYLGYHFPWAHPDYESFSGAVTIEKDISYGPAPDEKLDMCRPTTPRPDRPAVILIHGGTWIGGDKSGNAPILCSMLARSGIVAININYRLLSMETLENRWPAQLQDAQLAVRWLRAHAAVYHVDPAHVCADGISAGGQLALFLGALKSIHPGDRSELYPEQKPDVQCVVDDQGVADFMSSSSGINAVASKLIVPAPGENFAQALKKASPLYYMGPHMVPVLIIQGDNDKVVFPEQSAALKDILEKYNVPVKFIPYHGGHYYRGLPEPQVMKFLQEHLHFLADHLHP